MPDISWLVLLKLSRVIALDTKTDLWWECVESFIFSTVVPTKQLPLLESEKEALSLGFPFIVDATETLEQKVWTESLSWKVGVLVALCS